MVNDIEQRSRELAVYLLEHQCTVRAAAERFGVSKSTVHKDISERLEHVDRALWLQARALLERNKAERHIRGGLATRKKYKGE
ncbi:MAG: sporulation transcriptional regulator SpoIIID [Oscillospiraceae bacterium]|nr:sporulation transcriptional regulator SpoIIID [Oscillospiraceae bacterium]